MLERLLKFVPNICSTDAQLLMLEQYETLFGIYDHTKNDPDHPFAVLELHPAEDNYTHGLLRERMVQFAFHKVNEAFSLSWFEFLQLPCYDAAEIMEIASLKRARDEKTAENLVNQLPKGTS
jgi:hypothetical protein